jgi:hypothetical protein
MSRAAKEHFKLGQPSNMSSLCEHMLSAGWPRRDEGLARWMDDHTRHNSGGKPEEYLYPSLYAGIIKGDIDFDPRKEFNALSPIWGEPVFRGARSVLNVCARYARDGVARNEIERMTPNAPSGPDLDWEDFGMGRRP